MATCFNIVTVDSFSSVSFGGNPAAVCFVGVKECLSDEEMQKIAAEMNISETAFIILLSTEDSYELSSRFALRWFTPTTEVPLCGHATLASAAAIFYTADNMSDTLEFITRESGSLFAKKSGDFISLDLPINPPQPYEKVEELSALIEAALGDIQPIDVQYAPEPMRKLLLRLPDSMTRTDLEQLRPRVEDFMTIHKAGPVTGVIITLQPQQQAVDSKQNPYDFVSRYFAPWNGIPEDPVTACVFRQDLEALHPAVDRFQSSITWPLIGVIITVKGGYKDTPYDFLSRFFAPWAGVNEDPVTGAAHTVLAPYWSKQLGKTELYARQCSARGGDVKISVRQAEGRMDLAGPATIVLRGSINITK